MPEKPQTPAFRPVNPQVQAVLGELPSGLFNFGLYFHKWFYVVDGVRFPKDKWRRSSPWACTMADETKVAERRDFCQPNQLLDNFEVSLSLFNGSRKYQRAVPLQRGDKYKEEAREIPLQKYWDRQAANVLLGQKNQRLENTAQALSKLGYKCHRLEFALETPLILGLGDEHPTEKGFRFDWTLGIPYIPASSLKGVVRLAWLVSYLNRLPQDEALTFCQRLTNVNLEEAERLPEGAISLFGCGGEAARRGGVIFLDAYPRELPRLKPEIMTCHYREYYGGERGPTENQQPNPQKFWAVDPWADEGRKQPLTFVFRLLLAPEVARDAALKESLLQAFQAALKEHGLGAKTAIGHGRFQPVTGAPAEPGKEVVEKPKPSDVQPSTTEVWEQATLSWNPGKGELTAAWQGRKAFAKGKDLIPEAFMKKLVKDKKNVIARVTVDPQSFRIVKIETR